MGCRPYGTVASGIEIARWHLVAPSGLCCRFASLTPSNLRFADEDPQSHAASYTFTAKTTDYASRFRLVFSGQADGPSAAPQTFAYYNGSEWGVSNQGRATLQVVDVMGRVLSSEQIDGNAEVGINQPAGVYMLRLVNGDNVKVQKVVVR